MNQYLYLPLKPTTNHQTNNMNKLMFLILLALSTCTSASTSYSLPNGINPYPQAHRASSETMSQLVNRIFLPIAILTNTGGNSTTSTPPC